MRRLLFVIVPLLLMLMLCERLRAQSIDPTLAAMILLYTEKAENSLRTEQEAMLLETSGHIWVKSEVEGVRKLDEEFNEYLDTFHVSPRVPATPLRWRFQRTGTRSTGR